MARQAALTTDDLNIIEKALTTEIKIVIGAAGDNDKDAAITDSAPLFAVREKIVAMKSRSNGPTPGRTSRARKATNKPTLPTDKETY